MRDNRELKRHKDEKLRVLLITIVTYFVFLVIKKMDIVTPYLGITMLILLYLYANYNLINMFFTSKRTTFKIYAFLPHFTANSIQSRRLRSFIRLISASSKRKNTSPYRFSLKFETNLQFVNLTAKFNPSKQN